MTNKPEKEDKKEARGAKDKKEVEEFDQDSSALEIPPAATPNTELQEDKKEVRGSKDKNEVEEFDQDSSALERSTELPLLPALQQPSLRRSVAVNTNRHESFVGAFAVNGPCSLDNNSEREDNQRDDEEDLEAPVIEEDPEALDAVLVLEQTDCQANTEHEDTELASGVLDITTRSEDLGALQVAKPMEETGNAWNWRNVSMILLGLMLALALILLLCLGIAGVFDGEEQRETDLTPSESNSSTALLSFSPTLSRLRQEGTLRCACEHKPGFCFADDQGNMAGFDASLCYAIAAAARVKVEFAPITGTSLSDRFVMMANGTYDVLTRTVHSMKNEVHHEASKTGFAFTFPYIEKSAMAVGDAFFVQQCADKEMKHIDECSGLMVCVERASTDLWTLQNIQLSSRNMFLVDSEAALTESFVRGDCNVKMQEQNDFFNIEQFLRDSEYNGTFVVGSTLFSLEPLALVTRADDPGFSNFVNSVLLSLPMAEFYNVTQATSNMFPPVGVFGSYYRDAFRNAIKAGGNYGEIYDRYLQRRMRLKPNYINDGSNGLLLGHPFGQHSAQQLGPQQLERDSERSALGTRLTSILERGTLRCGIRTGRPGLVSQNMTLVGGSSVQYSGMEVDLCLGLASSLFNGDANALEFVVVGDQLDGAAKLMNGECDVMTGAAYTLENTMQNLTTFSFSRPYLYATNDSMSVFPEENLSLMTMSDDHDWSSFVRWSVEALNYAELAGLVQESSNWMPEVINFGPRFHRMFRDLVYSVGSYQSLYERNMQSLLPRGPPNVQNMLAIGRTGAKLLGPQMYALPGIWH